MPFNAPRVYAAELMEFSGPWLGQPLWYPEPSGRGEVQIGDVGCIFEGRFHRFFNIMSPAGAGEPRPNDFEVFNYDISDASPGVDQRPSCLGAGTHASKTVSVLKGKAGGSAPADILGAGCKFESNKSRGAILHLKDSAVSKKVLALKSWEKYVKAHSKNWGPFLQNIPEMNVKSKNLILVTGYVKSSNWAVTAFEKRKKSLEAHLKAEISFVDGEFAFEYSKAHGIHKAHLSGPPKTWPSSSNNDQCIFLNYIQPQSFLTEAQSLVSRLRGGAGPAEDGDDAESDSSTSGLSDTDDEDDILPCAPLRQYIRQQRPDVKIAIVSDSDLEILLGDDTFSDSERLSHSSLADYLREKRFPVKVDEDQVGTLCLRGLVQQAQVRREQLRWRSLSVDTRQNTPCRWDSPTIDSPGMGGGSGGPTAMHREDGLDADDQDDAIIEGVLERIVLADGDSFRWMDILFKHNGIEDADPSFSISSDGEYIVTCGTADGVRLWNCRTGIYIRQFCPTSEESTWSACAVAFSPDEIWSGSATDDAPDGTVWTAQTVQGRTFVTVGEDFAAIIWNIEGRKLAELQERGASFVAYSPTGQTIATALPDDVAYLWAPDGKLLHELNYDGQTTALTYSPDGRSLLLAADASGYLWSCESGGRLVAFRGHTSTIWAMKFSHQGSQIVSVSDDRTVRIWDVQTGDELVKIEHMAKIWAVDFSPDDQAIVSGSSDGSTVVISNSAEGWQTTFTTDTARHSGAIYSLAYSHDGRFFASGDDRGRVKVWIAKTGAFMAEFRGHQARVKSVVWTPDDRAVVSSSEDGTVRSWSVYDARRFL